MDKSVLDTSFLGGLLIDFLCVESVDSDQRDALAPSRATKFIISLAKEPVSQNKPPIYLT